MERVLVTGATGFVGRHLCRYLRESGYLVRATCRKVSYRAGLPADVECVELGAIGPDTDWSLALDGVDYVVHLAAAAHHIHDRVPDSVYDDVNHFGTARLAAATALVKSVRRLVFISSVAVVGGTPKATVNELTACAPVTAYGRSKLAAEQAIENILGKTQPDWCILRPPLVYGPGNPGNMERLLRAIRMHLPMPLKSIKNQRTLLYVGNLVDAIGLAMRHPAASKRTFFVTDEQTISTPELIEALGEAAGCKPWLIPMPTRSLWLLGELFELLKRFHCAPLGVDREAIEKLVSSFVVDGSLFRTTCLWRAPVVTRLGIRETLNGPYQ